MKTCKNCLHQNICDIKQDIDIFVQKHKKHLNSATRVKILLVEQCKDFMDFEELNPK